MPQESMEDSLNLHFFPSDFCFFSLPPATLEKLRLLQSRLTSGYAMLRKACIGVSMQVMMVVMSIRCCEKTVLGSVVTTAVPAVIHTNRGFIYCAFMVSQLLY